MTTLTPKQQVIFDKCMKFVAGPTVFNGGQEHFVVAGLAGAGKTTLLVEVVRGIMAMGLRPAVCTPTGKAAHVINSKQNVFSATTLHRALTVRPISESDTVLSKIDALELQERQRPLLPFEKAEMKALLKKLDELSAGRKDRLKFEPVEVDDFLDQYDILVFDESSMLGEKSHMPLISRIPCKKIFFGDGAQLPPVLDTPAINLTRPHHYLDEILRQANGSGIIPLSHHISKRNDYLPVKKIKQFSDITIIDDNVPETIRGYENEHQIVVWKNSERHEISKVVRQRRGFDYTKSLYGYEFLPLPGEQLMIDENDVDLKLLKGQLVTVTDVHQYNPGLNPFKCRIKCTDEAGNERDFAISLGDLCGFTVDKSGRRFWTEYYVPNIAKKDASGVKRLKWWADKEGVSVMFPYALTAHKAQGSEWNKVFVLNTMFRGKDWPMWTYTAVTRAAKELVIADYTFKHG